MTSKGKYVGEINGLKMYEINPEKKAEAVKRGFGIFCEAQLRKYFESLKTGDEHEYKRNA